MLAATRAARRSVQMLALAAASAALLPGSAAAAVHSLSGGPAGAEATAAAQGFGAVLPAAAAPSGVDRIEAQAVGPFLTSSGGGLTVHSALGAPTVAKDPARGFALDTGGRPLAFAPAWADPAAPAAGMVDRSAAVYPAIATSTDALVRPTAAGIATYLRLSDPLARGSFEWMVGLRAGERLCELGTGAVAVVDGDCGSQAAAPDRRARIAPGGADPRTRYDRARARHADAAAAVPGTVVALIQPPEAQDAAGEPVATSLRAHGAVVSLAVRHNRGLTSYPAVATVEVSYADAWERSWTHVDGIGPAQRFGGLVRALLPSGRTLTTHGPDPADTDALEGGAAREWDGSDQAAPERGDPAGSGGTGFDESSDEAIDPPADETEDRQAQAPIGGSGPPFVCADTDQRRLTLVYAGRSAADLTPAIERRMRKILTQMNDKLYGESIASGGRANPARLRVSCVDKGVPEILAIKATSANVIEVIEAAIEQGVTDRDSKYLIFSESLREAECGIGDIVEDDEHSTRNGSNGPTVLEPRTTEGGWAILWGRRCWDADLALHENGHTMGAVQGNAPGNNGTDIDGEPLMHCADGYDVMCYEEPRDEHGQLAAPYSPHECAIGNRGFRYDCHYDSYFDTLPEEGEYLSDHWNVGSRVNLFLSFAKPRPFHEPFVFVGGDGSGVAGIHRAADGLRTPAEPIYNVAAGEPDRTTVSSPALAPDGKRVVFAGDGTSSACTDIYTMSLEGGPRRLVFDCTERFWISASNPEFMSDGRIAFDHAGDIWWVKTDGTDVRRIIDWEGGQSEPTYSGSGLLVAFSSTHNQEGDWFGHDPQVGSRTALFVARRHGGGAVQMTDLDDFTRAEQPKFSHDGAWLTFFGVRAGETEGHVYVVRVNGTGLRQISDSPGGYNPEWTPTGRIVYAQVLDAMDTSIARLVKEDPGDGSRAVLVDGLGWLGAPAFRQASYPVPGPDDPAYYAPPEYEPLP